MSGFTILPDALTRFTTAREYRLGQRYTDPSTDFTYEYGQFLDAVTYAAGQPLQRAHATSFKVTNDISGGSALTAARPAGICLGVPTQNQYGWVLRFGYYATVVTNGDDDIAAGDAIIVGASDGVVDSVAAATTTVHTKAVGYAPAVDVDADNTVGVWVDCLHN